MRMKKLLTSVCAVVMIVALGACGGGQTPAESTDGNETVVTEQPDVKEPEKTDEGKDVGKEEVPSEDKTEEDVKEPKEADKDEEVTQEPAGEAFNVFPSIEETVLWDEKGVKITATELTYTKYDAELSLLIENNSDKEVSIIAGSAGYCCNAVNGYMVADGYLNEDVSAGKKAKETIAFSLKELAVYGITEIAEIQVGFDIDMGEDEEFYTGPRVVKTSVADTYDFARNTYRENVSGKDLERDYDCTIEVFQETEKVVMDGLTLMSYALVRNFDEEQMLLLEMKNDTEEVVRLDAVGLTVNGLDVYRYSMGSDFIAPSCRCVMNINLDSNIDETYRSAFGLTSMDKLSFTIKVRDEGYRELLAETEVCLELGDTVTTIDASGTEVFNQDGIRIVSKGLFEDSSEYSDDIHLVMLVENATSETIRLDNVYDSLSVNGFMTDYSLYSEKLKPGALYVMDIEIDADSLADNEVEGIADITEVEFSVEFKTEKYDEIADVTVKVEF